MNKQTAIKYADYLNAYQTKLIFAAIQNGKWCVVIHNGSNTYYDSVKSLKSSKEYKAALENEKALKG